MAESREDSDFIVKVDSGYTSLHYQLSGNSTTTTLCVQSWQASFNLYFSMMSSVPMIVFYPTGY